MTPSRVMPQYPVFVISKGRAGCCLTARALLRDRVPFRLVIEAQEEEAYRSELPEARLAILPFSNLGLGSIPARNWVWEQAKAEGAGLHWILDDNIREFWRRFQRRRIRVAAGIALRACEAFTDRHENVAMSGLQYKMFVPDGRRVLPVYVNVRVYSCILLRTDLPFRWRGRYNEDTDLSLQILSAGWCTLLLNAFMAGKITTMTMKGGNSSELYQGDGRLRMARSLQRMWPGVVTTERRYQRPQHVVDFRRFDTTLVLKPRSQWPDPPTDADMRLVCLQPPRSERMRRMASEAGAVTRAQETPAPSGRGSTPAPSPKRRKPATPKA